MSDLSSMIGPVTVRYPAGDAAPANLVAELSAEQPLVEGEATEDAADALALIDGWGREIGIRFRHLPVGQERSVLLEDLVMVSRGATPLSPLGRAQARDLKGELWVFVTPA
jgi:hypothetical protein